LGNYRLIVIVWSVVIVVTASIIVIRAVKAIISPRRIETVVTP
jgi:hypothetical protein